jgi:hypothetical protein
MAVASRWSLAANGDPMTDQSLPLPPFRRVLSASAGTWAPAAGAVAAATWLGAALWQPMPFVHAAAWLLSGLVLMPLLFALAIGLAVAGLSALLAALALSWRLSGRPTGLGAALVALWALPASILPGYWLALRRVRRPGMWGALLGFAVGIGACLVVHGFRPRA